MNTPDKAVEAAARAVYENNHGGVRAGIRWDEERNTALQYVYRQDMRIALAAAAPFIRAEALRAYAAPLDDNTLVDADMIRNAADYYESQAGQ